MPLESLFSNPNPAIPRHRSLLARFAPLSKHARNFEVEIELEQPWKTYAPGEIVKGNVMLTVTKGFDITHLVVALHGFAKVYRNMVTPGAGDGEAELLVNGKGASGFEFHGKGLASLFQDEIVLCGSGFLRKHVYKFGFELEFPAKGLPSSIEFERGTIAYVVSATLTRPTTMAPTSTCFKAVRYQDDIDIANISAAKTKMVSLEPLSRRAKIMKIRQSDPIKPPDAPLVLTRRSTDISTMSSGRTAAPEPPLSPAPSETTAGTGTTTSSQSFQMTTFPVPMAPAEFRTSETLSTDTSASAKIITAMIELTRQGALPEDSIPLRIFVQHTKAARGVVIVTLYRQARVDMHPAIPMGRKGKGKEPEYEDIYPKSRTGLGGLYFANGSPSSTFRMDLAQTSTLMVVDPHTLTADVRTSIRVPKDAMPTTANVPGDMISFKYYVEVVVDINGKLGEMRFLPSLTSNGPSFTYAAETNNQLTSEWANSIVDTTQIRRNKSVVCQKFAVVVGTRDSVRSVRQRQQPDESSGDFDESMSQGPDEANEREPYPEEYEDGYWHRDPDAYGSYSGFREQEPSRFQAPPTQLVPPPEPEEEVDEKTRLRRQEELLLPSEPPTDSPSISTPRDLAPSAPFVYELVASYPQHSGSTKLDHPFDPPGVSTGSADTIRAQTASTPKSLEPQVESAEDKKELERRRLMAEASAPPDVEENAEAAETGPACATTFAPTAPTLDEEVEYTARTLTHAQRTGDQLPQYER